ncbi:ketosteroid isomerase [Bradyrhizobium lablabi]|uniref:Ketosteroid isomerase n=1 Tax=Bradyrhizobium lablabi TaxID=722472 RepID=A0A0R3N186_9BRAD|nr:SgcJ/EcaC family oxidoreductase [Bradyrhizobium lablabi]KRR23318.1 ketosteroid isomerase [Bradyrhizobium lablabi]
MGTSERSATDDIVSGIMGRWAVAFSKLDAQALASLYARNAFFFGSNPNLYRGNDGIAAYFDGLPRWQSPSVQFTDVRTAQAAPDLINVAGTASFFVEEGAEPLTVKITWVIVREDGDWKIVSHHVSSKTPLIEARADAI